MVLYAFIASVDIPGFTWEQPDEFITLHWLGHIHPDSREAFFLITEKIREGTYNHSKTDWASWAARVSKAQIIDFCKELYGDHFMDEKVGYIAKLKLEIGSDQYTEKGLKYRIVEMSELIKTISALDEKKEYALVAQEG
jgi:hypothetical protein